MEAEVHECLRALAHALVILDDDLLTRIIDFGGHDADQLLNVYMAVQVAFDRLEGMAEELDES